MDASTFRVAVNRSAATLEALAAEMRQVTKPTELAVGNIVRVRELADAGRETVVDLITDARRLAGRTKADAAPLSVELGAGLVQVLQLNDRAVCSSYGKRGLQVHARGQHRIVVTGNRDALLSLKRHAQAKLDATDTPLWHTASASSAVRQLEAVGV